MKNVYTKIHNNHLNKNDISGIAVDIRTQSGVTIWCQVRSGEDDKGEGGAEKGGKRCQFGLEMMYGRSGRGERDANLGWG